MRIICDAPGQTCNRLWTYVTSVAQCVAEKKKMAIIFFDWTIEDFPNLLHCPFIFYPLWQPWFFNLPRGWGWYKHLTWKVTHNKWWDKVFKFLGFQKGWDTMNDTRYLAQTKKELQYIFQPKQEITEKAMAFMSTIRQEADIVVGIHIRHGDYKTFEGGKYYYTFEEFHSFMLQVKQLYAGKNVAFFISSNEDFSVDIFKDCPCYRFVNEPHGNILDLYMLSLCDLIIGPWSTYSRWASFIGEVPLCCIKSINQHVERTDFSVITDFYHFENGEWNHGDGSTDHFFKLPTPQQGRCSADVSILCRFSARARSYRY